MELDYSEIGKRIARRRKELGVKQTEVCEKRNQQKNLSCLQTGKAVARPELQGWQTEEVHPAANPAGFGSSGTGEDIQTDYRNDGD